MWLACLESNWGLLYGVLGAFNNWFWARRDALDLLSAKLIFSSNLL